MYGDDYTIARCFYLFSVFWLAAKVLTWGEIAAHKSRVAISILASLSAIGILALSEGWIAHRKTETEHKASDSRFATGDLYGVRVEIYLTGMFWTFNGETVCSAPIVLYMDVVNKHSVPAMISQFDIQALEASGVWRQLAHVHPNGVHFGTTVSQVAPIKDQFLLVFVMRPVRWNWNPNLKRQLQILGVDTRQRQNRCARLWTLLSHDPSQSRECREI